jgi:pimeloyl-ACP methyl ester carboxylesterase
VDGVAWITNARTGQQLPLKWDIVDDIRKNGARLDVIGTAASIEVPLLVIHGDADETVSVESAKAIKSAAGAYATLEIIEGAGHTMNVGHPFQGAGPELDRAIDLTVATLRGVIPEAE